MGKSKNQKLGIMRTAVNMRAEYRKWLTLLATGLIICVIAVFVYMYLVGNSIVPSEMGAAWIVAAIAAAILGWWGNKFSKTHRQYESYLYVHKITNDDVVQFMKDNK